MSNKDIYSQIIDEDEVTRRRLRDLQNFEQFCNEVENMRCPTCLCVTMTPISFDEAICTTCDNKIKL